MRVTGVDNQHQTHQRLKGQEAKPPDKKRMLPVPSGKVFSGFSGAELEEIPPFPLNPLSHLPPAPGLAVELEKLEPEPPAGRDALVKEPFTEHTRAPGAGTAPGTLPANPSDQTPSRPALHGKPGAWRLPGKSHRAAFPAGVWRGNPAGQHLHSPAGTSAEHPRGGTRG